MQNKPVITGCIPQRKSLNKIRGYEINITLGKITSIITVVNTGISHQQYIGGMTGTVPVIVGVRSTRAYWRERLFSHRRIHHQYPGF